MLRSHADSYDSAVTEQPYQMQKKLLPPLHSPTFQARLVNKTASSDVLLLGSDASWPKYTIQNKILIIRIITASNYALLTRFYSKY